MASFKEIKKMDITYICDSCKKDFKANEIITVEACDNINIMTPMMPFVFIDKDEIITGGSKMADKSKGDRLLCCPKCKSIHLFGFTVKK